MVLNISFCSVIFYVIFVVCIFMELNFIFPLCQSLYQSPYMSGYYSFSFFSLYIPFHSTFFHSSLVLIFYSSLSFLFCCVFFINVFYHPWHLFLYVITLSHTDLLISLFPFLSIISFASHPSDLLLLPIIFHSPFFLPFFLSPHWLILSSQNGGSRNGGKEGGKSLDVTQIHPSCGAA